MRYAAAFLCGLLAISSAQVAASDDLPGWHETRWGMTAVELQAVLGAQAAPLPGRWIYGGAYAELAVQDVEVGGLGFTAYLQMNAATGRLQQVLLERRRTGSLPGSFAQVIDALTQRHGPPAEDCAQAKSGGRPLDYRITWRFPTTTLHATFLDFSTTAVFSRDPQADNDPLIIERKVRRNLRRFMPRRILLRYHETGRADLDPGCGQR